MMSNKDQWMTLEEYCKLTEKPITEEERKDHIEWVQKRKPEFEREREGAIKEEENDNE